MRPLSPKMLKIIFMISSDSELSVETIYDQARDSSMIEDDDYVILGDGNEKMSDILKKIPALKGRADKDTLLIINGHGIYEEVKDDEKKSAHMTNDVPTGIIFKTAKEELGLDHVYILGYSCHISGSLKRKEEGIGKGMTILTQGNSKHPIIVSQVLSSIKRAISLKAEDISNLEIFADLVRNSIQTFYFFNGSEVIKISRFGKFSPEEINEIIKLVYKEKAPSIIKKWAQDNKKNKQDFSYEGLKNIDQKLILSNEFYEELKEEQKQKLQIENIKKYFAHRSDGIFETKTKPDILKPEPLIRLVSDILCLESSRKRESQLLTATINQYASLIDEQDSNGHTPLMFAVIGGNLESVKLLIRSGTDVDKINRHNHTALIYAFSNIETVDTMPINNLQILEVLITAGSDIDIISQEFWVQLIARTASLGYVTLLNNLVKLRSDDDEIDDNGQTVLMDFISKKNLIAAKILIEAGINIDKTDNKGNTALMIAVTENNAQMVKLLVENGANVKLKNKEEKTAFELTENQEIIDLLNVKQPIKESKEEKTESKNNTPIINALNFGNMKQFSSLINDSDSNLDEQDEKGQTPLMIAIKYDNQKAVKILLENKVNLNLKDADDKTALEIAIVKKNNVIATLLINSILSQNIKDLPLDKIFKLAIDNKNFDIALKLTDLEIDISSYHERIEKEYKEQLEIDENKTTTSFRLKNLTKLKELNEFTKKSKKKISKHHEPEASPKKPTTDKERKRKKERKRNLIPAKMIR